MGRASTGESSAAVVALGSIATGCAEADAMLDVR